VSFATAHQFINQTHKETNQLSAPAGQSPRQQHSISSTKLSKDTNQLSAQAGQSPPPKFINQTHKETNQLQAPAGQSPPHGTSVHQSNSVKKPINYRLQQVSLLRYRKPIHQPNSVKKAIN
jgi:hypothetical protein